ncbi:unnamed protein product [Cuscuta campestris]|uniref:Uncharacterized protein n=1 Tax=Cuscuta campestris TaxID=132261 RepID=A0A484K8K0_9ASTE|nr:unnamed protein product [Cuscuta campestris]
MGKECDESDRAGDQFVLHMEPGNENDTVTESVNRTPEAVSCAPLEKVVEVGEIKDPFETPTQMCEALMKEPEENLFYPLDFNIFSDEPPRSRVVEPSKELQELIKAVEEEVKDSDDEDDVNKVGSEEEKCTQIVVYAPLNDGDENMDPVDGKHRPRREMKAPRRFTSGEDALGRNNKHPKTNTYRHRGEMMDEEMFKGPFSEDPDAMPLKEAVKSLEDVLFDGLLKNHVRERGRKYLAGRDEMDPSEFKPLYGLEETMRKSWYYKLFFHGHG